MYVKGKERETSLGTFLRLTFKYFFEYIRISILGPHKANELSQQGKPFSSGTERYTQHDFSAKVAINNCV